VTTDYLWCSVVPASVSVISSVTGYSSSLLHNWLITSILWIIAIMPQQHSTNSLNSDVKIPLSSKRQHISHDVCLEVLEGRLSDCCVLHTTAVHNDMHTHVTTVLKFVHRFGFQFHFLVFVSVISVFCTFCAVFVLLDFVVFSSVSLVLAKLAERDWRQKLLSRASCGPPTFETRGNLWSNILTEIVLQLQYQVQCINHSISNVIWH